MKIVEEGINAKKKFFGTLRQPVGKFLLFLFKLDLGISLMFYAFTLLLIPIVLLPIIGIAEVLWPVALGGGMVALIVLAWRNAGNRGGILLALFPLAYGWWLTDVYFILGQAYTLIPLAGIFGWFFIVFTSIVVIFAAFVLIEKTITNLRARVGVNRSWAAIKDAARKQRGIAVGCLTVMTICGLYAGTTIWSFPRGVFVVTPQDYYANFAFWASTSNGSYTPTQLAELDEHSVILAGGWDNNVSAMQYWLDHYPNVRFSFVVPGAFCDANALSITEQAKTWITNITTNNLTNVIGLTLDWEGKCTPTNPSLHQETIEIWSNFLDWKELNAPENFTVTLLDHTTLFYDHIDGDMNMHQFWQAVDFEVPRFDEYAPMLYRCAYGGAKPFGDPVTYSSAWDVSDTYSFYQAMELNARGVAGTFGNLTRLGVYLGETNCSCYGRDTKVYENGVYMGTGWDMLVQDTLICKAFGARTITYFLMQANPTDPDPAKSWWMGGGFDAYGDDFLDRLDTAVNGVNSTRPISINIGPISVWKSGLSYTEGALMQDYLYNLDHPLEFAIWMGIIIALGVLLFWREWRKQEKNVRPTPE